MSLKERIAKHRQSNNYPKIEFLSKEKNAPNISSEEKYLINLWEELLDTTNISVQDNFFNLGGNSFQAIQMIARVEKDTGKEFKPRLILLNNLAQIATQFVLNDSPSDFTVDKPSKSINQEWKPFFFNSKANKLYGVYHMANSMNEKQSNVIICNPIGLEYMRSYWAIKQLAIRLSRAGHHVLRFDYSHTGNSTGENNETTIENWIDDIKTAIKELCALSSIRPCSIVGLRFGALLAASVANTQKLKKLILWDPAISGVEYLQALKDLDSQRYKRSQDLTSPNVELLGFPYPSSLKSSIEAENLSEKKFSNTRQIHCVVSKERPDLLDTLKSMSASGAIIDCTVTTDAGHWDDFRSVEKALIVNPILDTIVEEMN